QHALFRGGTGDRPARLRRHGGAGQVPVAWRGDRMSPDTELPLWAAIVTAALVLLGASLALIGPVGLLRLKTFYERVHAPTLGTTLVAGGVLLASMLFFYVLGSRLVPYAVLITI